MIHCTLMNMVLIERSAEEGERAKRCDVKEINGLSVLGLLKIEELRCRHYPIFQTWVHDPHVFFPFYG